MSRDDFHKRLERTRIQRSLSRKQLAEKIGVTWGQHIYGWEREGRLPRDPSTYAKLGEALSVSEDFLRHGIGDDPTNSDAGTETATAETTAGMINYHIGEIAKMLEVHRSQLNLQIRFG